MTWQRFRPAVSLGLLLCASAAMFAVGLQRSGVAFAAELHMADLARDGISENEWLSRPPAPMVIAVWGFRRFGSTAFGGRLPTAVAAIAATLALALAVASVVDLRAGVLTGIAYIVMPLVFLNARSMIGAGLGQSLVTALFAGSVFALWARPPPNGRFATLFLVARAVAALPGVTAVLAAGWMLGVAPVLVGVGAAVALRFRDERGFTRVAGLAALVVGAAMVMISLRLLGFPRSGYNPFVGVGIGTHAPSPFATHEVVIEHIGLATYPWTGLFAFGVMRLALVPPVAGANVGLGATLVSDADAFREMGLRLGALLTLIAAVALHTLHWQTFGPSPFLSAAPLAVALGLLFRDMEREARPYRTIAAIAALLTLILARDYVLYPKSAYAALALADGGPPFPTAFTSKIVDWFTSVSHEGPAWIARLPAIFRVRYVGSALLALQPVIAGLRAFGRGAAPAEIYFVAIAAAVFLGPIAIVFQGSSMAPLWTASRPYDWACDIEQRARADIARTRGRFRWYHVLIPGLGTLAALRVYVVLLVVVDSIVIPQVFRIPAHPSPKLLPWIGIIQGLEFAPAVVLAAIPLVMGLWACYAVLGPHEMLRGSRRLVADMPRAQTYSFATWFSRVHVAMGMMVLAALVWVHGFDPVLTEHLSPQSIWATVRRTRTNGEPVGRFGGTVDEHALRYNAGFEVTVLQTEEDSVRWLRTLRPRHFLVVGTEMFPQVNRGYRRSFPAGSRVNVPVLDDDNRQFFVTWSEPQPSHNPLDSVVGTRETATGSNDHWHPQGHRANGIFAAEAARFAAPNHDPVIEYLGYNLDSHGRTSVPPGGDFKITYHFHALRDVDLDEQLFVHVDGHGACAQFNADHIPGTTPNGLHYPTILWLAGDYIHDEQTITIPANCGAGTYTVYIGLFHGTDRMAVSGGEHDNQNRVVAAAINVR